MAKHYFYSSDIRGLHRAKFSLFQKKFYAKLYRLKNCRTEAICSWRSKVYGRFEEASPVTGRIFVACE